MIVYKAMSRDEKNFYDNRGYRWSVLPTPRSTIIDEVDESGKPMLPNGTFIDIFRSLHSLLEESYNWWLPFLFPYISFYIVPLDFIFMGIPIESYPEGKFPFRLVARASNPAVQDQQGRWLMELECFMEACAHYGVPGKHFLSLSLSRSYSGNWAFFLFF